MDARLVWNTWRRLLREDDLAAWVMQPQPVAGHPAGCSADEIAILTDYARTPAATNSNFGMYRRGLTRNALGALDLVPLSRRLLHASGLDDEQVATEFVRSIGYVDHGPYFWRTAAGFVAYLATHPEFAAAARQDVLAFDAATIALTRRLGEAPPAVWPEQTAAHPPADDDSIRFQASPAATVVSSRCDLTSWIENPFAFDPEDDLEASPRHWMIVFPAAEAAHEYAEISARGARIFDLLCTPMSVADLSLALDGLPRVDVYAVICALSGLGAVTESQERPADAIGRSDCPPAAAGGPPGPSSLFSV